MFRSRGFRRGGLFRRAARLVIITPSSTPGCTVFPFDKVTKKFNTSNYNPAQTQGRVSQAEIDSYLEEIGTLAAQYYKEIEDKKNLDFWLRCIGLILLPLLIIYVCCIRGNKTQEYIEAQRKLRDTVTQLIFTTCSSFTARGFTWKLPGHFPHWIELRDMNLIYPANYTGPRNMAIPPPGQQVFPMQNGGNSGYFQPNVNIQMVTMQQQQPWNQNTSGDRLENSMVSFQQNGYPAMQGGNQQGKGKGGIPPNKNQDYGHNYYS